MSLPILVALALFAPALTLAQTCPTTCGASADVTSAFSSVAVTAIPELPGLGTPLACASYCAAFPFYQFLPNAGATSICRCYVSCAPSDLVIGGPAFIGLTALCDADFAPSCPVSTTWSSGNANFGFRNSDAAVLPAPGAASVTIQNSPFACLQRCLTVNGAAFYQWAAASAGTAFVARACLCLNSCPSSRIQSLSPGAFVHGSLCASDTPPATCATPFNFIPLNSSGLSCSYGGVSSIRGFPTVEYRCRLCNPSSTQIMVDTQLTVANFQPLQMSDSIAPTGRVPGVIRPKRCLSFWYRNPAPLRQATLSVSSDPFGRSAVVPTNTGGPISISSCGITNYFGSNGGGTVYSYGCTITNVGSVRVGALRLDCSNFSPLTTGNCGFRPDCSFDYIFFPGRSCRFFFTTKAGFIAMRIEDFYSF